MIFRDHTPTDTHSPDAEDRAAEDFARRRLGQWSGIDESNLQVQLAQDAQYADAFRRVEQSWMAVGKHATSAELMALREQAIARARRANARRWVSHGLGRRRALRIAAGVAALGVALTAAYQLSPFGLKPGEYRTAIGEQRTIELEDHSRIALDAATRLRVRFSKDGRIVRLIQGQAQFSVAKDPGRPFKVEAGDHTVVAVGTVFTVEYVDRQMHVAMLEGKVAILPQQPRLALALHPGDAGHSNRQKSANGSTNGPDHGVASSAVHPGAGPIELIAGQELRVQQDGQAIFSAKADLEAATAWREGKVILNSEPLGEAVRRLNRYSRLQLQVDDQKLAAMKISGVFDAGDAAAFVEAVQSYLPATADYSRADTIYLRMK